MEGLIRSSSSLEIMFWCVIMITMIVIICRVMIGVVLDIIWLKPKRIRSILSKQGIRGPKPSFLYGNIKEIRQMESTVMMMMINKSSSSSSSSSSSDDQPAVSHHQWLHSSFPYLQEWSRRYGPIYMFSTGTKQHLYVNQPELIKELKLHKSLDLGKPAYLSKARKPILGNGIIKANGHHWAHQRKLIAPHFFPLQVKGMVDLMEECATAMIRTWEQQLKENGGEVVELKNVYQDLRGLSIDILSKAFFGSSHYLGITISIKLRAMEETLAKPSLLFGLPYLRFLPTKGRRKIWRLKKEVEALILKVINGRQEGSENDAGKCSKDLLQLMLERASVDSKLLQDKHKLERFMVDTCKNIYFAGSETVAASASWALMLLALHPEWQQRVRSEIIETCGDHRSPISLDWDKLSQLKTLGNVILESLRLYAPSAVIAREALEDIKLGGGNFVVPKGVHIWSFVPLLHRDPENWGPDANEFNPQRFCGGISEACKYPQAYVPFGYGTRLCLGQTFAMLELKLVLCLLLSRFSFSVSPNYIHSPVYKMLLMPRHGMRLLVKKV